MTDLKRKAAEFYRIQDKTWFVVCALAVSALAGAGMGVRITGDWSGLSGALIGLFIAAEVIGRARNGA
jgi:hypothetical protein